VFDEFQIPYSALQREHEATIARAAAAGAGTVIRGGAARGAPSEDKNWGARPIGADRQDSRGLWERAGLDDLLEGQTRMQFLLRFTFSHPDLHTTIIGTSNPAHLGQNLDALKAGPLPSDVYEEAKRRLETAGAKPAE
jgi:aryl-alcohol dehydrogenase-like predicted oxidoreductase